MVISDLGMLTLLSISQLLEQGLYYPPPKAGPKTHSLKNRNNMTQKNTLNSKRKWQV